LRASEGARRWLRTLDRDMRARSVTLLIAATTLLPLSVAWAETVPETGVPVKVERRACGEVICRKPPCINQKRLPDGRIHVEVETYVPITQEISPRNVDYSVDGDALRLSYRTTSRDIKVSPPGTPIPACLEPIKFAIVMPGLPQAQYRVTVEEKTPYYVYGLALGFIAFVLGVVVIVMRPWRRSPRGETPSTS